jgi:thioredoxin reductase (NADPH)
MSPISDARQDSNTATSPSLPIEDVIIVGAGAAGLTAAIYLGRFRRRCLVVHDGDSRARWIPTSHNIPGFTAGVSGEEFLTALKAQALKYGAQLNAGSVISLARQDEIFCLRTEQGTLRSRFVLLATGVKDHIPAIEGAQDAILRSLLRFCPICDAFEAIDKRIAVIGNGALGGREASFLRHYSGRVTLLHVGAFSDTSGEAEVLGLERIVIDLKQVRILEDRIVLATPVGKREFDLAYIALGCSAHNEMALELHAQCDEHGALRVNAHQETTVPGLYAAGDVVRGLNQVVVAAAEAAIAATDIHNKLRGAL